MSELLEGVQLSDFMLAQCISRGGIADVYRGYQIGASQFEVAVKVFRSGYAQRATFRDYFMTEAEKIGQFEHPNILPFLEFGEGDDLLYTVTPYISSGTLGDLLKNVGGKFSAMQALPIMQQMSSALQYAHERDVIHGNIKLSNVFVGVDGRVLLGDFGIARGFDDSQQSLTRVGWGTAEYAAPEQSLGVLRRTSDIYALGVLLFRILTGQPPFTGQTPVEVLLKHVRLEAPSARSIDPLVSDTVDSVVQKALRKRSEDRYPSAEEFINALQEAVTISPVASPVAKTAPAFTRQLTYNAAFALVEQPSPPSPLPISFELETPVTPGADAFPLLSEQFGLPVSLHQTPQPTPQAFEQHPSGEHGERHFLQEEDASTPFFWSVEPLEWSPIGNELVGPGPLTASDYLRAMPVVPEEPTHSPALPAIEKASEALASLAPGSKSPEEAHRAHGLHGLQGWRKKGLPLLVVALLLIGLLGALLSSFQFPGPSSAPGTSTHPSTLQSPSTSLTATSGTPVRGVTPTTVPSPVASPSQGTPTTTATVTAQQTPTPLPSPSSTPVPLPTNPAVQPFSCATDALALDGSASFLPVIQQLTSDYNNQCASNVNFAYNANGSQAGLNELENGTVGLAYSDLPSSGRPGLVDYQVAALTFAVVVNSDTNVTNLTVAQLQGIYTGKITNWSQVGGTNEPIVIVSQFAGSTIRTIFETFVLRGTSQTVSGISSGTSVQNVSGGITYMPLADVPASGNGAQSISINGASPTTTSVANGSYPFWSMEHLYTALPAQNMAHSLIDFCFSALSVSDFTSNGAVPYQSMSAAALRSHLPSPTI